MNDLRLLENFVAVFRTRSFRAAAEELGMSQSSVTKRIQVLEQQLALRLFNRTTRSVEPTDSARQLIASAEEALQSHSAFQQEAGLLAHGEIGAIRVSAMALAAETLLIDGLAGLAQTHPQLEVEVVVGSSDIYRELATGVCDVAIGDEANFTSSAYAGSLRVAPLHQDKLVYVHRRDHPATATKHLKTLLAYPLAIPSRYFNENRLFAGWANQTNPAVYPRYKLNSLSACLSLAATSDTVAIAPQSQVSRTLSSTLQPALEIAAIETGIEVSLVLVTVAKNAPTPAVRAFADAIKQAAPRY